MPIKRSVQSPQKADPAQQELHWLLSQTIRMGLSGLSLGDWLKLERAWIELMGELVVCTPEYLDTEEGLGEPIRQRVEEELKRRPGELSLGMDIQGWCRTTRGASKI